LEAFVIRHYEAKKKNALYLDLTALTNPTLQKPKSIFQNAVGQKIIRTRYEAQLSFKII